MENQSYAFFQQKVLKLTGIDLRGYKSEQMVRRLGTLMSRCNASSFTEFGRLLESNPKYVNQFLDYFTINVSEFFRDPLRFQELEKVVLPQLLKGKSSLRIWSAGCSNGAEPYSVAMILSDLTPAARHFLLATDIDATILRKAAEADSYSSVDVKNVEPQRLRKYFVNQGDRFAVTPAIKSRVEFRRADLLAEPAWGNFDLVLCRNVAIYFTEDVKERMFANLSKALRVGGMMFIGSTETIRRAKEVGLESALFSFYRRVR